MNYEVREESTPEDRSAALRLRHEIFVVEQGIPAELDADGRDERSVHVLAFLGREAVATARVTFDDSTEATISRVAVLPDHRGTGLGGQLVAALEAVARRRGRESAVLEPHDYLEPFYAALGYRRCDGETTAGRHRLIRMRKYLAATAGS